MFLRCTTASYHACDFRREKMKIEDGFGLAGKQGGLAKAPSAVTLAASAASHPARAGTFRVRSSGDDGVRWRSASNPDRPHNKEPGARPGFALQR